MEKWIGWWTRRFRSHLGRFLVVRLSFPTVALSRLSMKLPIAQVKHREICKNIFVLTPMNQWCFLQRILISALDKSRTAPPTKISSHLLCTYRVQNVLCRIQCSIICNHNLAASHIQYKTKKEFQMKQVFISVFSYHLFFFNQLTWFLENRGKCQNVERFLQSMGHYQV